MDEFTMGWEITKTTSCEVVDGIRACLVHALHGGKIIVGTSVDGTDNNLQSVTVVDYIVVAAALTEESEQLLQFLIGVGFVFHHSPTVA